MWKVWQYKPWLLLQAYRQLSKWDRIIRQQSYAQWKHHLASKHAAITPEQSESNTAAKQEALSHNQLLYINKHILAVARHHPRPMNCLRRCLALKAIIEQGGGECQLHIGVKIETNGQVAAHSWISANGRLVNDSPEEIGQYKEITHNNALFAKARLHD